MPPPIYDIDAFLDEQLLARQTGAEALLDQETAAVLRSQKLQDYGYAPTQQQLAQRQATRAMLDLEPPPGPYDSPSEEEAVMRGLMAQDPYFLEHDLFKISPEQRAEYSGVDPGAAAPSGARYDIESLPPDLGRENYEHYATVILQDAFRGTSDNFDASTYGYNVRTEPNTNRTIFNDPLNENKPTYINPPGIDFQDIKKFAVPIAFEVAGGLAGAGMLSASGPPGLALGAVVGESVGTLIWRTANLDRLQKKGYLPPEYDIMSRALKDSAFTGLFALGAPLVFKALKMGMRVAGGPGAGFPLDEKEFMEAYEYVKKELGEDPKFMTSSQTVLRARAAKGQIGGPSPAEEVERALHNAAQTGWSGRLSPLMELRDKYIDQMRANVADVQKQFGEATGVSPDIAVQRAEELGGPAIRLEQGPEFLEAARQAVETSPSLVKAEAVLTSHRNHADEVFRLMTDGAISPADAGAEIRRIASSGASSSQTAIDEVYEEAFTLSGLGKYVDDPMVPERRIFQPDNRLKPFDYSPLKGTAEQSLKVIRGQKLAPDEQLAGQLTNFLNRLESGSKVTTASLNQDLTNLRTIIRQMNANGQDTRVLRTLRDELLEVRKQGINSRAGTESGEAAVNALDRAEDMVRQHKENFDNNLIRGILNMERVSMDLYQKGDSTAYRNITNYLRGNITRNRQTGELEAPDFIMKLLTEPKNADGVVALQNGVRQEFRNQLLQETPEGYLIPKGGPAALNTFKQQNDDLIEMFFSPAQRQQFQNAGEMAKQFRLEERQLLDVLRTAQNSNNLKGLIDGDVLRSPETLFENTWGPGKYSTTKELYEAVTNHGAQHLTDNYRSYILKDFMDSTLRSSGVGGDLFRPSEISQYLQNNGDAMRLWFGDTFVDNLGGIQNKLKALEPIPGRQYTEAESELYQAANSLARAYVGLFTTPGRVLTAVKMIGHSRASTTTERLLSHPQLLYNAFQTGRWQRNPALRAAVRAIGRIYYRENHNYTGPRDTQYESDITPLESVMFGPGSQIPEEEPQEFNLGGHVIRNLGSVQLKYGYGE
jgi:hypothetical protein